MMLVGECMFSLTFDAEWWCVTACVHQTAKKNWNICDFGLFEDWGILDMALVRLSNEVGLL